MILPGVRLRQYPTDSRPTIANDNEQVFTPKTILLQLVYQFDVGQALLISADFVLALNDVTASFTQDAPRLPRRREIQIQNSVVVFLCGVRLIVLVIPFVILMVDVSSTPRRMHVWGIEDNAVDGLVLIRQSATIYAFRQVGRENFVSVLRHFSPEDAVSKGHVSYCAPGFHVKRQHKRKHFIIRSSVRTENQIVSSLTARGLALLSSGRLGLKTCRSGLHCIDDYRYLVRVRQASN